MKPRDKMTALPRVALALALVLCLGLLAMPARALGAVDTTKHGTLTLRLPENADPTSADAKKRADLAGFGPDGATITVHLYKVADITASGTYKAVDALRPAEGDPDEGSFAYLAETVSEAWQNDADYWLGATATLLQEMYDEASLVPPEGAEDGDTTAGTVPTVAKDAAPKADLGLTPTDVALTKANSYKATVEDLPLGLYLAVAEPVDTARYSYTFTPWLLTVPMVDLDAPAGGEGEGDGETAPGTADGWLYSYTADLKPAQTERLGQLLIEKKLARFNETLGETGFVFKVVATLDTDNDPATPDETVYSNVFVLKFSSAGTQQLLVPELPVGATVTVTEVNTGVSYKLTSGEREQTVTVPALDADMEQAHLGSWKLHPETPTGGVESATTAYVYFENDYDSTFKGSVSAENRYHREEGADSTGGISRGIWSGTRVDAPTVAP